MQVNLLSPVLLSHSIFTKYIMQLSFTQVSLFISGSLSIVVFFKYLSIKKKNQILATQLSETAIRLEKQGKILSDIQGHNKGNRKFQNSIDNVELTTRFQSTRLQAAHASGSDSTSFHPPEKYSYIRSLSEKGMGPEEIAAVLSISQQEASQLVTLTMINPVKQQNQAVSP